MEVEIRFIRDANKAKALIDFDNLLQCTCMSDKMLQKLYKYGELLGRVAMDNYPSATELDRAIDELIKTEVIKTKRELWLEKSKNHTIYNCACHQSDYEGCECSTENLSDCYDCEHWEPIKEDNKN